MHKVCHITLGIDEIDDHHPVDLRIKCQLCSLRDILCGNPGESLLSTRWSRNSNCLQRNVFRCSVSGVARDRIRCGDINNSSAIRIITFNG